MNRKTVPKKTWLSWSSGKDSAWAFYQLRKDPSIELTAIFTTVNKKRSRVVMHGTRYKLLQVQASRLKLPLHTVYIPEPCDNKTYLSAMQNLVSKAQQKQIEQMAFGDLFLQNVRSYREQQLLNTGIQPIFPLWSRPTTLLAKEMMNSGIKAIITCVDGKQLPEEFVGRPYDRAFLDDLPKGVDPCGENGEFHSFVYDAPMFETLITFKLGQTHRAGQFTFIDVYPFY